MNEMKIAADQFLHGQLGPREFTAAMVGYLMYAAITQADDDSALAKLAQILVVAGEGALWLK